MNKKYKIFVSTFLLLQSIMMFCPLPKIESGKSYAFEVISEVIFTLSKINHTYNFFTSPYKKTKYSYITNDIFMLKNSDNRIVKLNISNEGSIRHITNFFNASRLTHIQNMAVSDTLLYNAVVRSEVLFFSKQNATYPLIYFEVITHNCEIEKVGSRFRKVEALTPIYKNYFTVSD